MKSLTLLSLLLLLGVFVSSCDKIRTSWDLIGADTAYNQGNFKKAITLYKKVIESQPQRADLYWKLGIAYYSNGEKLNTQKQIIQLRKLGKDDLADDLQQLHER